MKKFKNEFSYDYFGEIDEENKIVKLINIPTKEYINVYKRIRKLDEFCKIQTEVVEVNKTLNINISNIQD